MNIDFFKEFRKNLNMKQKEFAAVDSEGEYFFEE